MELWVFVAIVLSVLYFIFGLYKRALLPPYAAKPICVMLHYFKLPVALALFELGLKKGRTPLWTQIDDHLWLGGYPGWHLNRFEKLGINAVVNLCYETKGPHNWYKNKGVNYLHLPTVDHFEPTLEDIEIAVEFIIKHVQDKKRVYVHCFAGRGRSAAVAICYLMKANNWDLKKAQEELSKLRPLVRNKLHLQPTILSFYQKHLTLCSEDVKND